MVTRRSVMNNDHWLYQSSHRKPMRAALNWALPREDVVECSTEVLNIIEIEEIQEVNHWSPYARKRDPRNNH